jgi:hypothetical protein
MNANATDLSVSSISPGESKLLPQLEKAIAKSGGVRALGRELNWNVGSMARVKAGEKMSPYRAVQLAGFVGDAPLKSLVLALSEGAKSPEEAIYWLSFSEKAAQATARLLSEALAGLDRRISSMKQKPTTDERSKLAEELMTITLMESWGLAEGPSNVKGKPK